jgi:hypothetical protein
MAKKKRKPEPGAEPGPSRSRDAVTFVRSSQVWKDWLDGLAEHDAKMRRARLNISETADRAFVAYAREVGYQEVPPPR